MTVQLLLLSHPDKSKDNNANDIPKNFNLHCTNGTKRSLAIKGLTTHITKVLANDDHDIVGSYSAVALHSNLICVIIR